MKHVAWCLLLLVALSACSSIKSRIESHPAAYAALSRNDQSFALQGRIREGWAPDAVYIAWGKADQVVQGSEKGKPFVTWLYLTTEQDQVTSAPIIPIHERFYGRDDDFLPYSPIYLMHTAPYRAATFVNGRVVQWADSTLPR
ncbi:MAG: hypothetical protein QM796_20280 [Chthoniobacteraceae bacterium]